LGGSSFGGGGSTFGGGGGGGGGGGRVTITTSDFLGPDFLVFPSFDKKDAIPPNKTIASKIPM
jgi:hypothetical protein